MAIAETIVTLEDAHRNGWRVIAHCRTCGREGAIDTSLVARRGRRIAFKIGQYLHGARCRKCGVPDARIVRIEPPAEA